MPTDTPANWPPYPQVVLGRGRWADLLKILRLYGSKQAAVLAETIRGQIEGGDTQVTEDGR